MPNAHNHRTMKQTKHTSPTLLATSGIIAVILIVIFSNWIIQSTSIGSRNIDLTEDKRHTLTDGTIAILTELDAPIVIRYYVTRKSELMPRRLKNYIRKVDALLQQYQQLSGGNLKIEHLDPQPDTDEEDSANLDGIQGQHINGENLYFGIAISCLNQKSNLPLLDPNDQRMLEYHLSSAIANVSNFDKPTIGLISSLQLEGTPENQIGAAPKKPWVIYQLLQQRYQLAHLGTEVLDIDPKDIPVLLLIHPADMSKQTEFLIDQYLLKGGIIIACLDPMALTAPQPQSAAALAQGALQVKRSTFTHLLNAWGVGMDSTAVIADGKFATDFKSKNGTQRMYAHLTLSADALTTTDEIITQDFESLYFPLAGGLTLNKKIEGLTVESLIESSDNVIIVPSGEANHSDPSLFSKKSAEAEPYSLVMRIKGTFPTAFPKGDPKITDLLESEPPSEKTQDKATDNTLKSSLSPSLVYLISDADFLFDQACFAANGDGYRALNNNAALLQNILDQCTGSKHLIGSRSRASSIRPFTVIKEMETSFAQELQDDVKLARVEMDSIISQLQALQTEKKESDALVLNPEQEEKITQLQEQQVRLSRDLREKQKGLQAKKDKLYAKLTWLTVATTPALTASVGICVWLRRRKTTRAH